MLESPNTPGLGARDGEMGRIASIAKISKCCQSLVKRMMMVMSKRSGVKK